MAKSKEYPDFSEVIIAKWQEEVKQKRQELFPGDKDDDDVFKIKKMPLRPVLKNCLP